MAISQSTYISVIICTYNRSAYIEGALESLRVQQEAAGLFEVLVVDNNSTDNTAEVCSAYLNANPELNARYLCETRQGASFARNTGALQAKGNIFVFMDDDATAEPDYIRRIHSFFTTQPSATGLGGRIIPRYIPSEPAWMSHYVSSMVGNFDYSPVARQFKEGKYPLESNMAVRAGDFWKVGGFNTALPGVKGTLRVGGEGKDFFLKLQALGKTIWYDPHVVVHHVVEVEKLTPHYLYRVASGYGRGEKVRTLAIGKAAYYKKLLEYGFKLGAAMLIAFFYVLQGKSQKAPPLVRFRIDALKGLLEPQHISN